ncbi:hypothetical protein [Bradyrhizobium sp. Ai1a-2]|uniref:hypothetical protein n=1 Tax=Bradyrhizobium sp. Ai1a-2 TaxID=196490 RepID=UPI0006870B48|nr:hypothetical protein [Bradyrhizobium sp. Ai1a-2]
MTEPLSILIEDSVQIAWDFLERTGELEDAVVASRFLVDDIELMVLRGERRRLLLSNKAIDDYRRFKHKRAMQVGREFATFHRVD